MQAIHRLTLNRSFSTCRDPAGEEADTGEGDMGALGGGSEAFVEVARGSEGRDSVEGRADSEAAPALQGSSS